MSTTRPKLHVYVDETGDRGSSSASSPIFGMAAIIVDEQGARNTRAAVQGLRADFKVSSGVVMSWKDHVKTHDRRRRAAAVLGTRRRATARRVPPGADPLKEGGGSTAGDP
jgi:hypothetical protein